MHFDLAPGRSLFANLKQRSAGRDRGALLKALGGALSSRLAERWVDLHLLDKPDWSNAGLDRAEAALHRWSVQPAGTEGFAKAEVTAGGVDTRELDARSMESLRTPGSTSSARSWTSPAGWVATTFNGPGPAPPPVGEVCSQGCSFLIIPQDLLSSFSSGGQQSTVIGS